MNGSKLPAGVCLWGLTLSIMFNHKCIDWAFLAPRCMFRICVYKMDDVHWCSFSLWVKKLPVWCSLKLDPTLTQAPSSLSISESKEKALKPLKPALREQSRCLRRVERGGFSLHYVSDISVLWSELDREHVWFHFLPLFCFLISCACGGCRWLVDNVTKFSCSILSLNPVSGKTRQTTYVGGENFKILIAPAWFNVFKLLNHRRPCCLDMTDIICLSQCPHRVCSSRKALAGRWDEVLPRTRTKHSTCLFPHYYYGEILTQLLFLE